MKSVSGKEQCKAVEKKGRVLRRINGSHRIDAKAGEEAVLSIPVHGSRTLFVGLQSSLMRAAGFVGKDL